MTRKYPLSLLHSRQGRRSHEPRCDESPARNPLEEIDWFGRQGFDFVDFTPEPPAADPGQFDPEGIRAVLDRHDLGLVAHTA